MYGNWTNFVYGKFAFKILQQISFLHEITAEIFKYNGNRYINKVYSKAIKICMKSAKYSYLYTADAKYINLKLKVNVSLIFLMSCKIISEV